MLYWPFYYTNCNYLYFLTFAIDVDMGRSSSDGSGSLKNLRHVSRRRFVQAVGVGTTVGLSGCSGGTGGGGNGNGKTTIQVAMPSKVVQNADATRKALSKAGLPDRINVEFLGTSEISGDVASQYQQWISASRKKPDVFRMDSGWTIPFIERNQIVDLNEHLSKDSLKTIDKHYFDPTVSTARGPKGNIYGVPWQVGFPTIQYRKDLVKKAGFNPDKNNWSTKPMTWKRFSQVIAKTHSQSNVQYGYAWQGNDYEGLACCTFNELMTSWGGAYFGARDNLFGPIGNRPITVDEKPVWNAIKMGRTFIHGQNDKYSLDGYKQISPKAVLQWTEGPSKSAFMNGNAIALRYWPGAVPEGVESFGDDLGLMPIPYSVTQRKAKYPGTGGSSPALGGWHLTVNPNSKNIGDAVKVIEATMKKSFRQFQFSKLGYLTADRRLFDKKSAGDVWGPYIKTLALAGENAIPRPATVVWPDESPLIAGAVNGSLAQQKAPRAAMSSLKKSLKDVESSV